MSAIKQGEKKENTLTFKQPINGLWWEKQTDTWHTANCQTIQSENCGGKNESKKCVLEKKREINFAYITFFVVNATFALRIPRFCFRTKTSEIDLPRISLVCLFFIFSFVSVILFILICLHSSYNIYKTSQKYKQIFC